MTTISITWADAELKKFGERLDRLQREFPKVIPREVNKVGNRARTQVIRNLTAQTGLPRKTIVKAVDVTMAGGKKLSYDMVTRGGNIRLKYVRPSESKAGVRASPWNRRTLFAGTFILGGAFPQRHGLVKGGHVMRRLDKSGRKLTFARSGMFIPTEMTAGATAAAFEATAAPLLQERIGKVLDRLVP